MIKPESGGFNGEKLKFARELNGLTLTDVAGEMDVSHQFVSRWEKGKSIPNFDQAVKLGSLLKTGRFFFFSNVDLPESTSATFFRRNASVTKKNQVQAESTARMFAYIESELSRELDLPYFTLPEYAEFHSDFIQLDPERIEVVANRVREFFELEDGPVSNVTLLVERLGIRVAFRDLSSEQVDAVTEEINGHQYIVINTKNRSAVRIRFNLAHELGHILLHLGYSSKIVDNPSNHKRIEWEANYFASCLLMPESGIVEDMVYTNLEYLKALKKHWLVSVQALVTRGIQLELIGDVQGLHLRQEISRKGWRKHEPFDKTMPVEYPKFLSSAIKYSSAATETVLKEVSSVLRLSAGRVATQLGIEIVPDVPIVELSPQLKLLK